MKIKEIEARYRLACIFVRRELRIITLFPSTSIVYYFFLLGGKVG
jgi:hypothetical protein